MIEPLLDEIAARGWLVNNLFQLTDTSWQANLRSPTHHTAFARGPTAEIALALAMDAIELAIPTPEEPTCAHTIAPALDLTALIANLRRSTEPSGLTRRKLMP